MVAVGLLLLSGCETARNMRADFTRLTSAQPATALQAKTTPPRPRSTTAPTALPSGSASPAIPNSFDIGPAPTTATAADSPARSAERPVAVALGGKSETELRALFGSPTSEEDRPPGKRWRYRDGQCTLDVQLYPDVQTKQFGTLAYEVKSDDNSDEGKRHCLAQLQSRVQTRN